MKKIFDWTIGSFFRSIGRIIAYVVIGGFIAILLSNSDFRLPKIGDLLGIDYVYADTFNTAVWKVYYTNSNLTTQLPSNGDTFQKLTLTQNNNGLTTIYLYTTDFLRSDYFDYITIPYIFSTSMGYDVEKDVYCSFLEENGGVYSAVSCNTYATNTHIPVDFNFSFNVSLLQKNGEAQAPCTITSDRLVCTLEKNVTYNRIAITYSLGVTQSAISSGTYNLNLGHVVGQYLNTQNEMVNQQKQTNDILNDDNTTSESSTASDFFNETETTSQSSLTSIVSSPLTLINGLTNGNNNNLCFTLKGKQNCLPSGSIIWGKTQRSGINWFGTSDDISTGVNAFKVFFNLVVGGYLLYKMTIGLFLLIERMLSPTNDQIEVMKL